MELFIGILIGICICVGSFHGFYLMKEGRSQKRALPPTSYDTRIDALTESGTMRYKLHKAMVSPSKRAVLRDSPIYAKAASVLGWEDED